MIKPQEITKLANSEGVRPQQTEKDYTSTNITRIDNITWDQVPLNTSGLLKPVTVQRVKLVK